MKKRLNFRIPLIFAISLAVGIACTYACEYLRVDIRWSLCIFAPFSLLIAALCCGKNIKIFAFAVVASIIVSIVGATLCSVAFARYKSTYFEFGKEYQISAVVEEISDAQDSTLVVLGSVESDDGIVDGKICAYLTSYQAKKLHLGCRVVCIAKLSNYELLTHGKVNYRAIDNVKYVATDLTEIQIELRFDLFGYANELIKDTLFIGDEHTASVVFAMLTGNSSLMDDSTIRSFRYGGIAHVFAVSGLHIGLIYSVLNYLLKKLRLNKILSAIIISVILIFYCGVCGFTPSSVRATVMCIVSCIAGVIYGKYDMLNALSVAVLVLLIINPLYLFGVGFQLSVIAVLSINMLTPHLRRIFRFLPNKIASSLSVCLAAQIGTLPILITSFGYVSFASLIINLVVLPLFSALYVIIFVGVLLSIIFPCFALTIITVSFLPMQAIISLLVALGFENTLISGVGGLIFVPLYFLPCVLFSDKLNIRLVPRCICVVLTLSLLIGYTLPQVFVPEGYAFITVCSVNSGVAVVVKDSASTTVVLTDDVSVSGLNYTLSKYGANNPDNLIVLGGDKCIEKLFTFGVDACNTYLPYSNVPLQPFNGTEIKYERSFYCGNTLFEYSDGFTLEIETCGISVCVCYSYVDDDGGGDMLITKFFGSKYVADITVYYQLAGHKFSLTDCGDLRFLANGGKLKPLAIVPQVK